jgi:hypothetical protein
MTVLCIVIFLWLLRAGKSEGQPKMKQPKVRKIERPHPVHGYILR